MQKLARDYLDELNRRHKKNRKALVAWILLATLVVGTVMGTLAQYGVAMEEPTCGKEAHEHSDTCYNADGQLDCELEVHTHDQSCYQSQKSNTPSDDLEEENPVSDPVKKPDSDPNGGNLNSENQADGDEDPADQADGDENPANPADGDENPANPADGDENPANPADGDENPADPADGDENPANPADGDENPADPVEGGQTAGEVQPGGAQNPADSVQFDTDDTEIVYETAGDFGSVDELAASPNNKAYSYMYYPVNAKLRNTAEAEPQWSFDAYYVNEADRSQVTKTDDFSLKYQMEFHASSTFGPGEVRIEIDEALFTYRTKEGQSERKATPSDIGVPKGGFEDGEYNANPSRSTPFNWYVENGKLIFYNYKTIDAGTNAAWQVLYSNLKIMDIVDETSWSMKPEVYINGTKSGKEVSTLTGRVNSSVSLTEVVKTPYYETGKKYTPGLYTLDQLKTYAGDNIAEKYIKDGKLNTAEYRYVVWDVKIRGKATQPWTMYIEDNPIAGEMQGEVVGYRDNSDRTTVYDYKVENFASEDKGVEIAASDTERSWGHRFQVVTAYPAGAVLPADEVTNNLTVTLEPKDKKDKDEVVIATPASWKYKDYDWHYEGNVIDTEKWNGWGGRNSDNTEYTGWLEAYRRSTKDYGDIPFTVTGSMKGYGLTHEVTGGQLGAYKEGTSYSLITTDDYLYAVEDDGTTYLMGKDDYYFSSVTVSQTDQGYNIYEDRTDTSERAALVKEGKLAFNFGAVKIYAMFADKEGEGTTKEEWELIGTVSMSEDGTAKYSFSSEQIAREPYRVKVEHESVDYKTECKIQLAVRLKKSSETNGVMKDLIKEHDIYQKSPKLKFENLSGVMGTQKTGTTVTDIYVDNTKKDPNTEEESSTKVTSATSFNYEGRDDLKNNTQALYGGLLVRDNDQRTVTWLETTAKANKKYSSQNDAANNRVLVDYYLTAYDGYLIYDRSCLDYMSRTDQSLMSPGRKQAVFYDLLPYGMQFDASTTVRAGRIKELDNRGTYMESPNDWDRTQVSVTVDPAKDIKTNYKGTGRTMVAFHITYSGADPAVYTNGKWVEGWGVTFRAYYDWKDMDTVNKEANANLVAFMPDFGKDYIDQINRDYPQLYGLNTQVYADNGPIINDPVKSLIYRDLIDGGNIDGAWIADGDKNENGSSKYDYNTETNTWNHNVLYAETTVNDNVATSSQSTLQKLVRADQDSSGTDMDQYGSFRENAMAAAGGTYTYELTVSAAVDSPVKNIAVFDRLEAAQDQSWPPQFLGVDLDALEKQNTDVNAPESSGSGEPEGQKIPVTVYYNNSSDAKIPQSEDDDPQKILTANDWYTADSVKDDNEWKSTDVRAVAVVFNPDYVLQGGHSVSFRIRMKAPENADEWKDKYAYNQATFTSQSTKDDTKGLVTCSPTRVGVSKVERLEIVKRTSGIVPTAFKDTEFEFKVYEAGETKADDKKLAFLSYELYRADRNGKWDEEPDGQPHATDENGCLYLKANEKAVFRVADTDRITVEESTNIFWEASPDVSNPIRGGKPVEERYKETVVETKDETTGNTIKTVTRTKDPAGDIHVRTWTNTFRPVLYVQKELIAAPEEQAADATFTFQLKVKKGADYVAAANTPYWYVDSARTDGSFPVRLDAEGQPWPDADGAASQAPHKTGENGEFTIKQGQIIALFPGVAGTRYELTELGLDENGYSENWYCEESKVTNRILAVLGSEETITNYYRWKDLNLTKKITHQEVGDCKQGFSFQIVELELNENGLPKTDNDGNVIPLEKDGKMTTAGLTWELLDADADTPAPKNGELTEEGKLLNCFCAGKTIRIHGLDACKYYMVKELPVTEDATEHVVLYQPVKDSEQFKILPGATAQDVTITNDYLKRPLTVKKTVTGEKTGEGEPEFTFTAKVNGNPLPYNTAYTVTKQGNTVASGVLDADGNLVQKIGEEPAAEANVYRLQNGKFKLHDGESITFENAGILGQTFEITEDKSEYTQLFPAANTNEETHPDETTGNAPATGTLLGEGGEASFVNGTPNALYISKDYVTTDATDSPADRLIKEWEAKVKELSQYKPSAYTNYSEECAAEFILEVTDEKGTYNWPKVDTVIYGTSQLEAKTDIKFEWEAGKSIKLPPWVIFSIPVGMEPGMIPPTASYKLIEVESSQKRIVGPKNTDQPDSGFVQRAISKPAGLKENEYVQITQKYPANGCSVSGTAESAPTATIVNELKSLSGFNGSKIGKRMTGASYTVPTGQKLVWRLEKYDGEISNTNPYDEKNWKPAAGVEYAVFRDDGSPLSGEVITTGSDGRIELEKPEQGYPEVRFVKDKVYINAYNSALMNRLMHEAPNFPDDESEQKKPGPVLRLVEVPEESGKDWGLLAGYGKEETSFGWDFVYEFYQSPTTYFFNSNSRSSINVEKYTKRPTSQNFTMILRQVVGTTDHTISFEQINSTNYGVIVSEPRDGVEYTIHNVDGTSVEGRTKDVTKSGGQITLRAGQYVTLEVPEGTVWTVEEDGYASQNYRLTGLEDTAASGRTKLLALDTSVDPTKNLMLINVPAPLTRYTLRFDANADGDEVTGMPAAIAQDSAAGSFPFIIPTDVPSREGYTFRGWSDDPDATEADICVNDEITLPSSNPTVTLYAVWQEREWFSKVIYYIETSPSNDEWEAVGSVSSPYTAGPEISHTLKTAERLEYAEKYRAAGYVFLGWSKTKNATTPEYLPGQTYKVTAPNDRSNVVTELYAVWEKLEFIPTNVEVRIAVADDFAGILEEKSKTDQEKIISYVAQHAVLNFNMSVKDPKTHEAITTISYKDFIPKNAIGDSTVRFGYPKGVYSGQKYIIISGTLDYPSTDKYQLFLSNTNLSFSDGLEGLKTVCPDVTVKENTFTWPSGIITK